MNLPKAIEILTDSIADNTLLITLKHDEAVHLGIEALARITAGRQKGYDYFGHLLPGETSE